MPQFFVPADLLRRDPIVLRGSDARHITSVLRLQVGDSLVLCDGEGGRYLARLAALRPLQVTCTILRPLPTAVMPIALALAAAIVRPERYEWLIEKAFELGCRRLIPLTTERTVAKYLPKRPAEKLARWQAIALAAAQQSGLPWRPEIGPITALPDLLASTSAPLYYCWEGLITTTASLAAGRWSLATANCRLTSDQGPATRNAVILIGPEGGFTATEHAAILAHHPQPLSLGPLILRTETAAITAITLVQQLHGYFTTPPLGAP